MSTTYARVTPSLPCSNPNASRTDERPVQLTRMDGHETRTDGHVDNSTVEGIDDFVELQGSDETVHSANAATQGFRLNF